jgi:hypothetical protein
VVHGGGGVVIMSADELASEVAATPNGRLRFGFRSDSSLAA